MDPSESAPLVFAAVGDVHGRHQAMVELVRARELPGAKAPALVLQVGDFECHRHDDDLASMAAPARYRLLGDFHRFHGGELTYPWPVYFVGGNHECYGWLDRHPAGFSPAPGCHYLGRVGYRRVAGLGVLGLSGVYDGEALERPRPGPEQRAACSNKALVGFTDAEVETAAAAAGVDVLLLHEWPEGVVADDDTLRLHNNPRIRRRGAGNPWAWELLQHHRPALVLCGHAHLAYRRALVWEDGRRTLVCCLGAVKNGPDAVALLCWDGHTVEELSP